MGLDMQAQLLRVGHGRHLGIGSILSLHICKDQHLVGNQVALAQPALTQK